MLRSHPQQKQDMPKKSLQGDKSKNNLRSTPAAPKLEIDEATEILLRAKQEYLENLPHTTLEDDFELSLLKDEDPCLRLHASRITELSFKENKTPLEKAELAAYEDPQVRPYVFHTYDLEHKEDRTKLEDLELKFLKNPLIRPHAQEILDLIKKNFFDRTKEETYKLKLFLDTKTLKNAEEIVALESLESLNEDQVKRLSIDYLSKIADVSCASTNDFHKNYRSPSLNPALDCVIRDTKFETYDIEVAKFRAIEDAFNKAAEKLINSYMRQTFRAMPRTSALAGQSLFAYNEAPQITGILKTRQNAIALTLEKLYFDNDISFSQKNLDYLTNYLNDLVVDRKLAFNSSQYKELATAINEKIDVLKAEVEKQSVLRK